MNVSRIQNTDLIVGWVKNSLARFGFNVLYFAKVESDQDDIYGIHSGVVVESEAQEIRVLMPKIMWSVADEEFVSSFESSELFTAETVQNGDVIQIERADGSTYRFKIVEPTVIGFETRSVTKFKVTPLGD